MIDRPDLVARFEALRDRCEEPTRSLMQEFVDKLKGDDASRVFIKPRNESDTGPEIEYRFVWTPQKRKRSYVPWKRKKSRTR